MTHELKSPPPAKLRSLPKIAYCAALLLLIGAALVPAIDELRTRSENAVLLTRAERAGPIPPPPNATGAALAGDLTGESRDVLASWGNIGGCGAGGGAASGSAVKWVGRGVTGGLVDVQCIATQTFFFDPDYPFADKARQTQLTTRIGTSAIHPKWSFAVTAPFKYNVDHVDRGVQADPQIKTAHLVGWGDLGLDVTRKLGITNASSLTGTLVVPTGTGHAARAGGEIPFRGELGTGVLGASLSFEHTVDRDWGLFILGAAGNYGGWENRWGDLRASSLTGFAHVGFLVGSFVPSLGLSFTGKFYGDREDGRRMQDQAMFLMPINASLEWSSDFLAIIGSVSLPMQLKKADAITDVFDSWMFGLGVQTSLF